MNQNSENILNLLFSEEEIKSLAPDLMAMIAGSFFEAIQKKLSLEDFDNFSNLLKDNKSKEAIDFLKSRGISPKELVSM